MTDNVTPLVPEDVDFDLDAEVRTDAPTPFRTKVGGRVIIMIDPETIDWKDLLDVGEDPVALLRYALNDEDREFLYGLDLEGWRLGRLMDRYRKHYGLDKKVQEFKARQRLRGV